MSTIQVIVVPSEDDQAIEVREIERGDLKAMQKIVGGYVQVIDIGNPDASILLNEQGKLEGLDVNRRATAPCWIHNSAFRHRDILVGNCFVTGRPDETGETTSAPQELLDLGLYDRKLAEGKRHTQAVMALARGRVNLWAMLRDQRRYLEHPSTAPPPLDKQIENQSPSTIASVRRCSAGGGNRSASGHRHRNPHRHPCFPARCGYIARQGMPTDY